MAHLMYNIIGDLCSCRSEKEDTGADGFSDSLDSLGFDSLFYASILKENIHFAWQRVGSCIVFNPKGTQFTVRDFLTSFVKKNVSIDINDMVKRLFEMYGVDLDKSTIVEKIKGSEIYYDAIKGMLYSDYTMYLKEK